jgi:putative NIF3 family GTP cyclohydrolase 1 type 2
VKNRVGIESWALGSVMAVAVVCSPRPVSARDEGQPVLTARQVIERVRAHVGVPPREQTVDLFDAGNPDAAVTGIAVTMMATLDVLQRAVAKGQNLIITHEGPFYSHRGIIGELEGERDALYRAKNDYAAANRLVIWRFHDSWHDRRPDGILTGIVRALGWEAYQQEDEPQVIAMPETTLGALARSIKQRLDARTLRIIGDPTMKVTKIGLQPGFVGFTSNRHLLQRNDVQVEVIGEGHEWEIGEYAADAVTAGLGKALIVIGHIPSEQAGMAECTRWLQTFVTEVPVEFVAAKQAFEYVD